MKDKIGAYRRADTMGKSQIDLILQVYDGAIAALSAAANHYRSEETNAGYDEMERAKKFVTHLYSTLDQEKGGEVAENLGKMYVYVISQVYVIEASKDFDQLNAVTDIMRNLRSGWQDIKDSGATTDEQSIETKDSPPAEVPRDSFVTAG